MATFMRSPSSGPCHNNCLAHHCLVVKILPDDTRKLSALFSRFLSHYLIRDRYGRPRPCGRI